MKKTILLILLNLCLFCGLFADIIKNNDQPMKGFWDFKIKTKWSVENYGLKLIADIKTFKIDSRGLIYIFDKKYGKFYVLDSSGEYKFCFGRYGEGPGEYMKMTDFFLVDKILIVYDLNKLIYFNSSGKFLKNVRLDGGLLRIPLFFLNSNNFIFTPKSSEQLVPQDKICRFNLLTNKISNIVDLTLNSPTKKINKILKKNRIIVSGGGLLTQYPGLVVCLDNNKIIWGNNGKYHIKVTGLNSYEYFSFEIDSRKPIAISEEFKKTILPKNMTGQPLPAYITKEYLKNIPDHSTFFTKITTTKTGLIYVYVSDTMRKKIQKIDIFSPTGQYLYQADPKSPKNYIFKNYTFHDGFLYAAFEDKYENLNFGKFSIKEPDSIEN